MNEFVEYLAELQSSSVPFENLHRLCLPFRSLAAEAIGFSIQCDRDDFTGLGLDALCDDLVGELLQEQPSLDWLEWDLTCLEGLQHI